MASAENQNEWGNAALAAVLWETFLKKGFPPDPLPKTFHSRPGGRAGLL